MYYIIIISQLPYWPQDWCEEKQDGTSFKLQLGMSWYTDTVETDLLLLLYLIPITVLRGTENLWVQIETPKPYRLDEVYKCIQS